jgi:hypothetical protein
VSRHLFEKVFKVTDFLFDGGELMFPGLQLLLKLFDGCG